MKLCSYGLHLCEICDQPGDGTAMIRSLNGEGIGQQWQGGIGYVSTNRLIVEESLLHGIVDAGECDQYKNWIDAQAAVNALAEMDGLLPELTGAIAEEERCRAEFMTWLDDVRSYSTL